MELSVKKGILEVNDQGGGATVTPTPGDKKFKIEGDLTQINKALSNFTYKTGAPNQKGQDTLLIHTADKGALEDKDDITIQVTKSRDSVCDPNASRKSSWHDGDLSKNISVGTVASYSIFRYNLADKKASFNAKAVGGGLSFRYYTDNQLKRWGRDYLNRPKSKTFS